MTIEQSDAAARGSSDQPAAKEAPQTDFIHAELSLMGSLPKNFVEASENNLKNNWSSLVVDAGVGLVAGAAIAAVAKNPALVGRAIGQIIGHENPVALGESMATFIKPAARVIPFALGELSLLDAGNRMATPALDLMAHPEHKAADEKLFAANVSALVQDYTVAGVSGLVGAKFSWDHTAPYVNRGPEVDFSAQQKWAAENPGQLNKAARVENPGKYVFNEEPHIKPDVEAQYNKAFPEEERQAVHGEGGYNEKIDQGANLVYTLRDGKTGELAAAHILGVHDQPDPLPASQGVVRDFGNWLLGKQPPQLQSMHGDFIFVRGDLRSQGVGSHMYNLVVDAIQQRAAAAGKHLVALTGEMEDPKEPAVDLVNALAEHHPTAVTAEQHADPMAFGRSVLSGLKDQYPKGIQEEEPAPLGQAFLNRYGSGQVPDEKAQALGETLQMLDERVRRQAFYWALPTPKVDSGVVWNIQDFNNPEYRGPAHWTSVVFDPTRFAPRETGYAFMTDEAGYTLDPNSRQVQQYRADNNYYLGSQGTALTAGALTSGALLGGWQLLKGQDKAP